MFKVVDIAHYLEHMQDVPLIDVRSNGEFEKGHIPNALNIPLFTNEERAAVGTVYKRKSREAAIDLGYQFVTPKLEHFINQSRDASSSKGIVIHCWRGGMRSKAFAEHLCNNGFSNVYLINRGYKAFRQHVISTLSQNYTLRVIGGYTGSGKTEILHYLNKLGHQVADLEMLANHKGSAFGGIGCLPQPTTEQFENNLFMEWVKFDISIPIWIEDESRNIGSVNLPQVLYKKMREQVVYFLDIPLEERARFLVKDYGQCDTDLLASAIQRITRKLGGQNAQRALEELDQGNLLNVARLALTYYDKSYLRGLQNRDPKMVRSIQLDTVDTEQNTKQIQEYFERI